MAHKTLIDGTAYEITGGRTLVNGTGYTITGGRTLVNGTGYSISFGKPIGSLDIGSSVWVSVDGVRTEFLIVNQGKPGNSSLYADSCDGTWLMMKDLYSTRQWHSSSVNDYENSAIHAYLNTQFLESIDDKARAKIKSVRIPYRAGSGYSTTTQTGLNGLSAFIFIPCAREVGFAFSGMPNDEGAILSYFSGTSIRDSDEKRIAKLNGSATSWWLRSPVCKLAQGSSYSIMTTNDGNYFASRCINSAGVRPTFILPFDVKIDDNHNVIG